MDGLNESPAEFVFGYFNDIQAVHDLISSLLKKKVQNPAKLTDPLPPLPPSFSDTSINSPEFLDRKSSEITQAEIQSSEFQPLPRMQRNSISRKRNSWFIHRKTLSEGSCEYEENFSSTQQKERDFKNVFGFEDSEKLLFVFNNVYIYRFFPILGRVYISNNHFCFKSKLIGAREKLILPLDKISKIVTHRRSTIFAYYLSIWTKDHEEILFDLHTLESHEKCARELGKLLETPISGTHMCLNQYRNLINQK